MDVHTIIVGFTETNDYLNTFLVCKLWYSWEEDYWKNFSIFKKKLFTKKSFQKLQRFLDKNNKKRIFK